jgi:hypothetical protein
VKATEGPTNEKPIDKRTCVRVRYAGQYHVDLPSYGELNGKYLLAVKGEIKWPHSDPLALTVWFLGKVKSHGEQLRRIVLYLKAWADFQSQRRGTMPSGLILTVLAANHFQESERDDVALSNTVNDISKAVNPLFFVLNPVDISEELTARLTEVQIQRFQEAIKAAAEDASKAIDLDGKHDASKHWRKQFGDRFPLVEKENNKNTTQQTATSIAAIYTSTHAPKPWGWR